ncbi:MAG TPA: ABC transporter substrate-binding protein [Streptosporangiaceae bacterium]
MRQHMRMSLGVVTVGTAAAMAVAGCGGSSPGHGGNSSSSSKTVVMGTTDRIVSLDPAGSYDIGSGTPELNIYQQLLKIAPGGTQPVPDAASCAWQDAKNPVTYICTMKPGQRFSNGDPLTAADAAYSFRRVLKIASPNGPASLLATMKTVTSSGDKVTFTLTGPNAVWPYVLTSAAGYLVDPKVFPADKILADTKVIGSGPYELSKYIPDQLLALKPNPHYGGTDKLANQEFIVKYEQNASTLVSDVRSGSIDIAYRDMSPTQVKSLTNAPGVDVIYGHGIEIRYLVFNMKSQPGNTTAQKHAIRQAIAYLVNRQDIASAAYNDTVKPLYSIIASGLTGHTNAFASVYGTTPNPAKAKQVLAAAGVKTPVSFTLWYNTNHYGEASTDEYTEVQRQLDASGLFKVTLNTADWASYVKAATSDQYGVYQLGWFPDYPDADDYTAPFYVDCNPKIPDFMNNHYCNQTVDKLTAQEEKTTDPAARTRIFGKIQQLTAQDAPLIPLWQGGQIAAVRSGVTGVSQTLDPSYNFRFWLVGKS